MRTILLTFNKRSDQLFDLALQLSKLNDANIIESIKLIDLALSKILVQLLVSDQDPKNKKHRTETLVLGYASFEVIASDINKGIAKFESTGFHCKDVAILPVSGTSRAIAIVLAETNQQHERPETEDRQDKKVNAGPDKRTKNRA